MAIVKEFKDFIMKGNVVDLAIAVIIGGAFGAIVNSLIADVITPLLLNPALEAAGVKNIAELTWGAVKYGNFLSAIISFLVIAFVERMETGFIDGNLSVAEFFELAGIVVDAIDAIAVFREAGA